MPLTAMSRLVRCLGLVLLLSALALLPGCLDVVAELVLKPDGLGILTMTLKVPQGLEKQVKRAQLQEIMTPGPQFSQEREKGTVEFNQQATFGHLENLASRRIRFEIERVDLGLLGIRDDTFRLTGWLRSLEGDRPDRDIPLGTELDPSHAGRTRPGADDPASRRARQLMAATLAGHYLKVIYVVPGRIKQAWPVEVGAERFDPQRGGGEGQVIWQVPMAAIFNAQLRHTLIFRVDFMGKYRFKAENMDKAESKFYEPPKDAAAPDAKAKSGAQPEPAQK